MSSGIKYRPEIDGLRAIAVVAVLLYHLGEVFLGVTILSGGFLGVDIFFVISGYLISTIILSGLDAGVFKIAEFYRRRIRRILPVYFLVLVATLPFAWEVLLPEELQAFARSLLSSIFFVSNFWFYTNDPYWVEGLTRPFLHSWSLAVEEQFYLVFPAMLLLANRYARSALPAVFGLVFIASVAYAHVISASNSQAAFFLLPSRMWELTAGVLLALAERHPAWRPAARPELARALSALGMLMMLVPLFNYSSATRHPSLLTLVPVAGAVMVIAFARDDWWINRILRGKWVVGIGLISYSLYLWHYPVFVFAQRMIDTPTANWALLLALVSVALSVASYQLVETPARNVASISFNRLAGILIVILVVLIPLLLFMMKDGLRHRFPEFLLSAESIPTSVENYQWTQAENNGQPRGNIILVGDSHMIAMTPELQKLAVANGFNFSVSAERGCQLIMDTRRVLRSTREPTHCTEQLQSERMKYLRSLPPSYVVLGGRLPLILEEKSFNNRQGGVEKRMIHFIQNPEASLGQIKNRRAYIREKYLQTVQQIEAMGHTVVLLYPIPEAGWHVPQKLARLVGDDWGNAKSIVSESPLEIGYDVFVQRTQSAYSLLDSVGSESVLRVYPEKLFCNKAGRPTCLQHDEEHVYYRDTHHPSAFGSKLIARQLIDTILSAESPKGD